MDFFRKVRGVEVKIYANNFVSDESVGIGLGPEELYAVVLNADGSEGELFELTDEEVEAFSDEATEAHLNDQYDFPGFFCDW